jgi:serine/threonine-protein kinase RsbW
LKALKKELPEEIAMSRNHTGEVLEVTVPSSTKHLHALGMLTKTLAESMGFGLKESEKTALAVEEALTNVIEHAYHGEQNRKMHVIFEMKGEKFVVRIQHKGEQIEPTSATEPDFSHFYRQHKKGGLGVLIMKRCMDEVTYKHGPRQNECCMVKYLKK